MKKKIFILVVVLFLIVLLASSYILFVNKEKELDVKETNNTTSDYEDQTTDEIKHKLQLEIVGPEEEIIYPAQARMYEGYVKGNGKYMNQILCKWDFYLNENNEEVLYQQREDTGVLSRESQQVCAFTSTFIDKIGKLRVVLTMTVFNAINDNLETISAERFYTVAR